MTVTAALAELVTWAIVYRAYLDSYWRSPHSIAEAFALDEEELDAAA